MSTVSAPRMAVGKLFKKFEQYFLLYITLPHPSPLPPHQLVYFFIVGGKVSFLEAIRYVTCLVGILRCNQMNLVVIRRPKVVLNLCPRSCVLFMFNFPFEDPSNSP
jgi:hypothetical protein